MRVSERGLRISSVAAVMDTAADAGDEGWCIADACSSRH
jgi:hypothetical protein